MKLLFLRVLFLARIQSICSDAIDAQNAPTAIDEHLSAAASTVATPLNSLTLDEIIKRDRRYLLFNSRSLTGECLDICVNPTQTPTDSPIDSPKDSPTDAPTNAPTNVPTSAPTGAPTNAPTNAPTVAPTSAPTDAPTKAPTVAPTFPKKCEGDLFTETKLNFKNANVQGNPTLHNPNPKGKLVYNNIGYVKGKSVKLEVTKSEGTQYEHDDPGDYKTGSYGVIRLQNKNAKGNFKFCFKDNKGDLVNVESFKWSILDLDMSNGEKLRDQVILNMDQVQSYSLVPNSEVEIICEDTQKPPAKNSKELCKGGRTIFQATEIGDSNNPINPSKLSTKQQKQTVSFEFRNRSCFNMVFKTVCNKPGECNDESSRGMLFAGEVNNFYPPECTFNLKPSEFMLSPNKKNKLQYKNNGDLVLTRRGSTGTWSDGTTLWSVKRNGNEAAGRVTMMGNGNLIVRGAKGTVLWSSNTSSRENWNSKLELRDNGHLVIMNRKEQIIWNSNDNK